MRKGKKRLGTRSRQNERGIGRERARRDWGRGVERMKGV